MKKKLVMSDKKEKKKKAAVRKTTAELIPVMDYDDDLGFYRMRDGSCMDLIRIQEKDLVNASEDEVEFDCLKFAKAYRLYADDLKIICLNFPCDFSRQKRFIEHKINRTKNEIFKSQLEKKKKELEWLEVHDTTREYYYMIFAQTPEQMEKNLQTLAAVLGMGRDGLAAKISKQKKNQILYRIYNKCSLVNK